MRTFVNSLLSTHLQRTVVGTIVFNDIMVFDDDETGSTLQVNCERPESSRVRLPQLHLPYPQSDSQSQGMNAVIAMSQNGILYHSPVN